MMQEPKIYRHHCAFCGGIITDPKSIQRGYGPSCWKKVRPQPIKPYIEETPFVDTGSVDYMAKIYGEFEEWRNEF